MKKHITIAVALAFVSGYSFAAELSITKSVKPDRVVTAKAGRALAQFPVQRSDFPSHALILAPKTLRSVSWSTTYYPDNVGERVQICYSRPYNFSGEDHCVDVNPNSSGVIHEFNSYEFDLHAGIKIRHLVFGGKNYGTAAGVDTVTINYSY